ncbi:hypothetical protein GQ53DRAFT_742464 [Thozetella sp. PMI_491]|nr:hypothetical protein GQ53DRAFT_742464 [Thozetella sp. PMI_491]
MHSAAWLVVCTLVRGRGPLARLRHRPGLDPHAENTIPDLIEDHLPNRVPSLQLSDAADDRRQSFPGATSLEAPEAQP